MLKAKTLLKSLKLSTRRILIIFPLVLVMGVVVYYIFGFGNTSKAAGISLSTSPSTVEINIPNRYRVIMNTGDTSDYMVFYDRKEDDTNPDRVLTYTGYRAKDAGTTYSLRWDGNRRTNVLESNATRVRVRVEGCLDTTGGGACLTNSGAKMKVKEDYTFTNDGMYVAVEIDMRGAYTTQASEPFETFYAFNTPAISSHSETILYGNGVTENTSAVDGNISTADDSYVVAQATGNYQDIVFGPMELNGDKVLSTSSNGSYYYEVDNFGADEEEQIYFGDDASQTYTGGLAQARSFVLFKDQTDLDTEAERESLFNDLTNPDLPGYTTGSEWDDYAATPALNFDGVDDVGTVSASSSVNNIGNGTNGSGFTAEAWIFPRSLGEGGLGRVLDKAGSFSNNGWFVTMEGSGSNTFFDFQVDYSGGGSQHLLVIASAGFITLNAWQHIAVTWDGSTTATNVHMYVNGKEVSYSTQQNGIGTRIDDSSNSLLIGNRSNGDRTFDGFIDELRVWNVARTSTEIQDNMQRQINPATSGLVGYWRMNENTDTTAFDETSNNNDGTITGSIWVNGYVGDQHNEEENAYTINASNSQVIVDLDGQSDASTQINNVAGVAAGATSITVDSTTGFPTSGIAFIEGDKFSYTGTTGTTFTGIPAIGDLAIIGHADNSVVSASIVHHPFYKVRNWRNVLEPSGVSMEGNLLKLDKDYQANIKPFTTSYFAQDILWRSSLESTATDIGSTLTNSGCTFDTAKYGLGLRCDASSEDARFSPTGNIDFAKGALEFWLQPLSASTDGVERHYIRNVSGADLFRLRKSSANALEFQINDGTNAFTESVSSANYSWAANEWVHIRLEWDDTASAADQQKIFINGTEPTHTDSTGDYDSTLYTAGTNFTLGNSSDTGALQCNCIIDEFSVYDFNGSGDRAVLAKLSEGGDLTDADEYLSNSISNYTFDFNDDDTSNRGEYIFLGSETQFQGINVNFSTLGVGSSEDFQWEYWNGTTWSSLTVTEQDVGACEWLANGTCYFTAPGNWLPYSVNGSPDLYYIRGHLEGGSYTTDPVEKTIKTDVLLVHVLQDQSSNDRTLGVPGSGVVGKGSDPIATWKFDEGYGTTTYDSSVSGSSEVAGDHHLSISGASWIRSSDSLDTTTTYLQFDGSNDFASDAYDPDFDFGTGGFTVTGWFKHSSTAPGAGTTDMIAARYGTAGWKVYMNENGFICFGIDDDSSWGPDESVCTTSGRGSLADSKWHHFSAVKDGISSITIYIDGIPINQDASLTTNQSLNTTSTFYIGIDSNGSSNPWEGFLDTISVYNYARTEAQVKSDFAGLTNQIASSFGSQTKDILTDGLVGWWKMDETSGNATDSSGNGITLTDTNTVAFTSGKFGNGGDFESGNAEYQYTADNATLSIIGSLTLAAWIRPESTTASTHFDIIGKWDGSNESYLLAQYGDELRFYLDSSSNYLETTTANLSTANWYHVAASYAATDQQAKIFVNGVEQAVTTTGNVPSSIGDDSGRLQIGAEDTTGGAANYYDGIIDDARIYTRALSPAEVQQLYNWSAKPVVYYDLNENTGTTSVVDKSGNGYTGTMNGSMTGAAWQPGKYGSALRFSGSSQYLSNNSQVVADYPFTLEAWVKTTGYGTIAALTDSSSSGATAVYYSITVQNPTGQARLSVDDNTTANGFNSTTAINDGNWHHVAGVLHSATLREIYVDGKLENSSTASVSYNTNIDSIIVGCNPTVVDCLAGTIDEVRVYNYACTPAQIIEDMNGGHPIGGSPVGSQVGYWKLDESQGTTAQDSSPNDNDLTLSSAGWTLSGKFGAAYDGASNRRLSRADDADFDFAATNDFSISVWFNRSAISAQEYLVHKQAGNDGYALYMDSDGDIVFGISDVNSASFPEETIGGSLSKNYDDGNWHHAVATKTGTSAIRLYVDGLEIASDTSLAVDDTLVNSGLLYVGDANATDGTDEWLGDLDELKIYRAALTPDQVRVEYNQGKAQTLGTTGTTSTGMADYSQAREFCVPGDTSTCNPPTAWWKMDENTGTSSTADSSGNANNGTMNGAMTAGDWVPGKLGSALDFDATDDYIAIGSPAILDDLSQLSFSAWIFPRSEGEGAQGRIINKMVGTAGGWRVEFYASGTNAIKLSVGYSTTNLQRTAADNSVTLNQWNHVSVTWDGTSNATGVRIYINGVETTYQQTINGSPSREADASNSYQIGNNETQAGTWDGLIDDVRIYNYVRTPAQVMWEYNQGAPIAWWKLDECVGNTAFDSAKNGNEDAAGNNGTITIGASGSNTSAGTCSSGMSTEAWNNGAIGKRGASLDLDGTDDRVTITDPSTNSSLDVTSFTLSGWFYWKGLAGAAESDWLLSKASDATGESNYWLGWDNNDDVYTCGFYDADTDNANFVTLAGTPTLNQWYHITCSFNDDTNTMRLFLNGLQVAESTNQTLNPSTVQNNSSIRIGEAFSQYANIKADDVRIYNYALTATQVKTVYNNGAVSF